MPDVTCERLRKIIDYDPTTGVFRWHVSARGHRRAGAHAGCLDHKGYRRIGIDWRIYKAHRLAWLIMHGHWPDNEIDHIDGNRDNNAIVNLRLATSQQNAANRQITRNNTSGFKGVVWHKGRRKWRAQIKLGGRYRHLGLYDTPELAAAAYAAATTNYNGEFARI